MTDNKQEVGLGDSDYSLAVYIAKRPPLLEYQQLDELTAVTQGEIANIGQQCGNGWRKVFNVYAKLLYDLDKQQFNFSQLAPTWQQYRDDYLLQPQSKTALLFSAPLFSTSISEVKNLGSTEKVIHIIMGRTYAKSLINSGQLDVQLTWLDNEFAISTAQRLIVCPYFDYRQLSNVKIVKLGVLMKEFH